MKGLANVVVSRPLSILITKSIGVSLLLALFSFGVVQYTQYDRLVDQLDRMEQEEEKVMTSTWTDWEGIGRSVTTPRVNNEEHSTWLNRHDGELEAAMNRYPLVEPVN